MGSIRKPVAVVAVAAALSSLPAAALAFTLNGAEFQASELSFCVEATPDDVTVAQAKTLLDAAIDEWHEVPHKKNSGSALTLTHHTTCQYGGVGATDYRLVVIASASYNVWADLDTGRIVFNDSRDWWDGGGTRPNGKFSYQGVLTHEMGHTFGLGHSGGAPWTFDSSTEEPTMAQCGPTPSTGDELSEDFETLQQDDWGGASWATNLTYDYFNANGGFEDGSTHWYRSNTSQISTGTAYARHGDLGLRMQSSGNYIYITSVYDPYILDVLEKTEVPGMTDNPTMRVRVSRRHTQASTTGGLQIQYRLGWIEYDDDGQCKVPAYQDFYWASAKVDLGGVCADLGTSWKKCERSILINSFGVDNDAAAFRIFFESTSSSHLYVDMAGVYEENT